LYVEINFPISISRALRDNGSKVHQKNLGGRFANREVIMVWMALAYGAILMVLGVGGYFGSGRASLTALIPCAFGLPVLVLAWLAWLRPKLASKLILAVLIMTLLGLLGTASALPQLGTLLSGGEVDRPPAVIAKSVMAILSLVLLGVGIGYFAKTGWKPEAVADK